MNGGNMGIREAARRMAQFPNINTKRVIVENYPRPQDGVFAYQFFDKNGRNVGYYLVTLSSLHILPEGGREWPTGPAGAHLSQTAVTLDLLEVGPHE